MYKLVDEETIKSYLPKHSNHNVSSEIVKMVQEMGDSIDIPQEYLEEAFINNIPVLKGTKAGVKEYINAIKYCNLKMGGYNNKDAWKLVFPRKYEALVQKGKESHLHSHVSIYNASVLVARITANMMLSLELKIAPAVDEAINKNIMLMRGIAAPTEVPVTEKDKKTGKERIVLDTNGKPLMKTIYHKVSPTVQQAAADSILRMAPPKEKISNTINNIGIIGFTDEARSENERTTDALIELAGAQRDALIAGKDIIDVQEIGGVLVRGDDDE